MPVAFCLVWDPGRASGLFALPHLSRAAKRTAPSSKLIDSSSVLVCIIKCAHVDKTQNDTSKSEIVASLR